MVSGESRINISVEYRDMDRLQQLATGAGIELRTEGFVSTNDNELNFLGGVFCLISATLACTAIFFGVKKLRRKN